MDEDCVNYVKNYADRTGRVVEEYEASIACNIDAEYLKSTKWPDRLADRIAAFGGSWKFIILFSLFLLSWVILNSVRFFWHFDPPPFILLNLVLSFIAAFQAPIIMMSQNRQAARDKHESVVDFAINYKAEREVDDMQSHLHRIEAQIAEIRELLNAKHDGVP
ncbi:Protein of unknown function DUF1003 [Acididesulfobacillus acetoxydans]|uniref:DUF1003 domain-containing protein n=1 Tax=Acididesulfobacillus acetoxydans TaxID=1561005 RepID=A0A8S0WL62_9FIRM|nr:DUF1003 domain-containing protein [Acididesulfobacillus acetoxydans]CAA7599854.1 Protein of unknown function DUF1003 [Acididesulfobacillus acetoxydans]CEJ07420.1 Protein of unknown function (DUF1003) [Acididesulfobacillus acetoxydans]